MLFVVTKQTEQQAEILKLIGFAFCAPFGRIAVEPVVVFNEFGLMGFITYLVFTLITGTFGVNCILRSYEVLEEKRMK